MITDGMMNNEDQNEQEELVSFGTRAGVFAGSMATVGIVDLAGHLGGFGIVGGAFLAVLLTAKSPKLIALRKKLLPEIPEGWTNFAQRFNNRLPSEEQEDEQEYETLARQVVHADSAPQVARSLFQAPVLEIAESIDRVTIELICEHIERNTYGVYVGRSLTQEGNPAVPLQFYKQHIEIIGKSQRGKSSMAAALMDVITRTHDPEYVQLALLDIENLTSKLFADLPHVMVWNGTKLHARTVEEVIEHLGLIVEIINHRYALPAQERSDLPVLLVYLEEFLALKNELKNRINLLKGEKLKDQREEATRAYAQLVLTVNLIALRGLKARVQLLLCAQVDYADNDFREALAQFGIRFSFCVDPDAARAAGFTANDLLRQNAERDRTGQAVLEARGIKDLLLSPDYELERRIIALEAKKARQWPLEHQDVSWKPGTLLVTRAESQNQQRLDVLDARNDPTSKQANSAEEQGTLGVQTFSETNREPHSELPDATSDERPTGTSAYRLSRTEVHIFIGAYTASGNIDKSLKSVGKGARYRSHAHEIIQAMGLK